MKRMKSILTVLAACAFAATTAAASAQIGRLGAGAGAGLGAGGGLGARLGARAQQRASVEANLQADLQAEQAAANAAAVPATPSASRVATPAVPTAQPSPTTPGAATTTAPRKTSDGSEFVVSPNATVDELVAQANALLSSDVSFDTEEEYAAWVAKMLATVGKIADRILAMKPDDKNFVEAISLKGQILCYQASLDSAKLPQLKAYADALSKHERVQSLKDGRDAALAFTGVYLQAKVADVAEKNGSAQELSAAMQEVAAFVVKHPETADMTVDLVYPVSVVAENVGDPDLPTKIWTPIRRALASSDSEQAKAALGMLDGAIRYSNLQGNAFEWKGCDPDGKPLDQSKVEGRVVVVEFWASWCQPCAQLHRQLEALYKTYHEGGFEILSYNLDAKLEDMNAYLAQSPVSGIILSDRATVDAKATSLAAYYGISEIPTMILVGGDGKVAAVDITIESLAATLQSVFKKPAPELPGLNATTADAAANSATNSAATTNRATTPAATANRATTPAATANRATTPAATANRATGSTTFRRP